MNWRGKDWFDDQGVRLAALGAVLCCAGSVLRGGEPIIFPNGTRVPAVSSPAFRTGEPIQFSGIKGSAASPAESKHNEALLNATEGASLVRSFEAPAAPVSARRTTIDPRTAKKLQDRRNEQKNWLSGEEKGQQAIDEAVGIRDTSPDTIEKRSSFLGSLAKSKSASQPQNQNAGRGAEEAEEASAKTTAPALGAHQDGTLDMRNLLNSGSSLSGASSDKPGLSLRELFPGADSARTRDYQARREEATGFLNPTKPMGTPSGSADSINPIPGLGSPPISPLYPQTPDVTGKSPASDAFAQRRDFERPGSSLPPQSGSPSRYSPGIAGYGSLPSAYSPRRSVMDSTPIEPPRRKF